MNRTLRFRILAAMALAPWATLASSALAEPVYPIRPIRMVVGYPLGSPIDGSARLVAERLGAALGQPVIVDNKAGFGTLGTAAAARAAHDGYTLLMGSTTAMAIAPRLYSKLPYDPRRDLVPVALLGRLPQVLVVNPAVPAADLKSLVELMKKSGGTFDYATFGNGSSSHLTMELLKQAARVDLRHIPYKSSVAAISDVIGGQVPLGMDVLQSARPHIESGRLHALAISAEARSSVAPDLPTLAELGYPGITLSLWVGVFAPAGTPDAIVQRLAGALKGVMDAPDMQAQLAKHGAEPMFVSGPAAGAFLDRDGARWAEAARVSGVRLD
ncbi:Bug family tripartite tricarboxylate transporter substrate binding protein [Variovorax sp. M-6]|uniref:Bug family tripartite tricarboxylate transporter substrate binding protein n=1 Tax=Variovorax sp. M-6 TaxID=3233041 RepID=UPI003F976409